MFLVDPCTLLADIQDVPESGEREIPDNRPTESLVPDLTAQPEIEGTDKIQKLEGGGTKQPCGRVVGIIRRHWRDKQYCGSLRIEGDRAVTSGKGQATSALFMPVDRKVRRAVYTRLPFCEPFRLTPVCFTTVVGVGRVSFVRFQTLLIYYFCCRSHGFVSKPASEMF